MIQHGIFLHLLFLFHQLYGCKISELGSCPNTHSVMYLDNCEHVYGFGKHAFFQYLDMKSSAHLVLVLLVHVLRPQADHNVFLVLPSPEYIFLRHFAVSLLEIESRLSPALSISALYIPSIKAGEHLCAKRQNVMYFVIFQTKIFIPVEIFF